MTCRAIWMMKFVHVNNADTMAGFTMLSIQWQASPCCQYNDRLHHVVNTVSYRLYHIVNIVIGFTMLSIQWHALPCCQYSDRLYHVINTMTGFIMIQTQWRALPCFQFNDRLYHPIQTYESKLGHMEKILQYPISHMTLYMASIHLHNKGTIWWLSGL